MKNAFGKRVARIATSKIDMCFDAMIAPGWYSPWISYRMPTIARASHSTPRASAMMNLLVSFDETKPTNKSGLHAMNHSTRVALNMIVFSIFLPLYELYKRYPRFSSECAGAFRNGVPMGAGMVKFPGRRTTGGQKLIFSNYS
jgi:hypothetical protein